MKTARAERGQSGCIFALIMIIRSGQQPLNFLVHILRVAGSLSHLCFLGGPSYKYEMARSSGGIDWPADNGKTLHFRLNLGSNFIQQLGREILQRSNGDGHLNMVAGVRYVGIAENTFNLLLVRCLFC